MHKFCKIPSINKDTKRFVKSPKKINKEAQINQLILPFRVCQYDEDFR